MLAAACYYSLVVLLSRLADLQQYPALSCIMMVPHPQNCGRYLYDNPRASREDTWNLYCPRLQMKCSIDSREVQLKSQSILYLFGEPSSLGVL